MKNSYNIKNLKWDVSPEDSVFIKRVVDKLVQHRRNRFIWKNEESFVSQAQSFFILIHLNHHPLNFNKLLSFSEREFYSALEEFIWVAKKYLK